MKTIDEAIRVLTACSEGRANYSVEELIAAEKLGIEALKDLKKFDEIRGRGARLLLPGETET